MTIKYGNAGADTLAGGSADDTLFGLGGDDNLDGHAGDDQLHGGEADRFQHVHRKQAPVVILGGFFGKKACTIVQPIDFQPFIHYFIKGKDYFCDNKPRC